MRKGNKKIICLVSMCFFFITAYGFCFKSAPPEKETIFSENKEYSVKINPDTGRHTVYSADKPNEEKWSFQWKSRRDTWAISNDGKSVIWLAWKYVKNEDFHRPCIVVFDWKGVKRFYSYKDISVPREYKNREKGPIGGFWRVWSESVKVDKEFIYIEPAGKKQIKLKFKNGEILSEIIK
jgi:hypothetical protein